MIITTSIAADLFDLDGITPPATESLPVHSPAASPCATVTEQRLSVEIGIGAAWVSLRYSSAGETTLRYLDPAALAEHVAAHGIPGEVPEIGTIVATGRRSHWAAGGCTWWIPDLQLRTTDRQILSAVLAGLEAMRAMPNLLAPTQLCVLQLIDAVANTLTGSYWVSITDTGHTDAATLIEALHMGRFLTEHDAEAAALAAHAYRARGFEDADDGIEIVHSSQLTTAPAAA